MVKAWFSSAVPPGFAGPIEPAEEVKTTRSTSARSASSIRMRVPTTLTSNTRSALPRRIDVVPAQWKTRSTPSIARRTARRSVMSPVTRSNSILSRWTSFESRRASSLSSSPRRASARTRGVPMKPEPPVTRVFAIAGILVTVPGLIEPPCLSPPPKTAVVCDTTAYLPAAVAEQHDIRLVSLYVSVDGQQQAESEVTDLADFYERLRASESGATTSQPSVGDFTSVYEPLLAEGRDVVSLHISAGISGTCEAAGQARERLRADGKGGERIR